MPKYEVIREFYRVVTVEGGVRETIESEHADHMEALRIGFALVAKGQYAKVQRVAAHEPVSLPKPDDFAALFAPTRGETITGEVTIPGPSSFQHDPRLSRYHPVNGWVVPEFIEIEDPA